MKKLKIGIFGPYFWDFEPCRSDNNLKIGTDHISIILERMKQKKMDFETGSKKIFVKRLKTLKIPYFFKKSPSFFRFMKIAN